MINRLWVFASASLMLLTSQTALAINGIAVPEIDGAGVGLALGLTVAIIALVKERRRK